MKKHLGKRLFITGIPTSGKSYLARKLASRTNGVFVELDDFRESLSKEEKYNKWTQFYLDQNEEEYYTKTSPEEQWNNLVAQSEGLWPAFLEHIESYSNESRPVIFECVNMLPHIVKNAVDFPGVVLIGSSYEEVFERNMKDPRWGKTPYLQELEAKSFFYIERPRYKDEAEKYGYPVFESADEAFEPVLKLLG